MLSEENADVGGVDWPAWSGKTAIHYAVVRNNKNLDIINCLLNHKTCSIDVLNKKDNNGNTALAFLKDADHEKRPIKNDIEQLKMTLTSLR